MSAPLGDSHTGHAMSEFARNESQNVMLFLSTSRIYLINNCNIKQSSVNTGWAISREPQNYVKCDVKRCKICGLKFFPFSWVYNTGSFVEYNEACLCVSTKLFIKIVFNALVRDLRPTK